MQYTGIDYANMWLKTLVGTAQSDQFDRVASKFFLLSIFVNQIGLW